MAVVSGRGQLGDSNCLQCGRYQAAHSLQPLGGIGGAYSVGVEMLLDRACVGGGWNSGNSVVYGVPLPPHVEATAIALLALQDEPRGEIVQASVNWLESQAARVEAVSSLSWCILTLFVYQRRIEELKRRVAAIVGDGSAIRNNATLATALLALRCGEMIHPFLVLR
jgi:hypothetical protein